MTGNTKDYYKIVSNLGRLDRGTLKIFKERYLLSLKKVKSNEFVLPYRFAVPKLDLGFVFIPLNTESSPYQRIALNNMIAHKYDQRLTNCIGISFQRYGHEHFDVGWCFMDGPWQYDEELESMLEKNYPFREANNMRVFRY